MNADRCPHCGAPTPSPVIERFAEKIEPQPNGCWLWTGTANRDGYGRFYVREAITELAHRWAYEQFVGPIPEGMPLDHLCRNRSCVNPDHLEPVTQRENQTRSPLTIAAQNLAKTHCPLGHPYNEENTYLYRGGRRCRACRRTACRRYDERKAAS
jgi:hypothetical protein